MLPPTAFAEFVHIAIRFRYQQEQLSRGNSIRAWKQLFKQDAGILQAFAPDLELLRLLLVANGLLFVSQNDLGPIASGRSGDEELVHVVGTYGIDSGDAMILIEAQRYGTTDIVTLDKDLQRAHADFTIYTWV